MDFETIDKLYCIYMIKYDTRYIITHSRKIADKVYDALCDYNRRISPKQWNKYGADYFNIYHLLYFCVKIGDTFRHITNRKRFTLQDLETYALYMDLGTEDILIRFGIKQKTPRDSWSCFGWRNKSETTSKDFLLG